METEEIKVLIDLLSKFNLWELLIMLISIGLTFIFKIPIKKQAVKLQKKYGVDKSMLTWITALIPYVLCGIMVFFLFWYRSGFIGQLDSLAWTSILAETGVLGSGAIGIYEAMKKLIKGFKAIHEKKQIKKEEAETKPASKFRIDKKKGDK